MPSPSDDISALLQTWRHAAPEAPRFNAAVWARIEAHRQQSAALAFYRWALPLAASVALIAGASAARLQGDQQHRERMAASLVRSIDPLQMATHHHHTP